MTGSLVIGLDIGTASTKAVLADATGTIRAEARRQHEMALPRPGWAQMDAERDWWDDAAACLRELVAAAGSADAVAAVCVSGLGPALVTLDEAGAPLHPAIMYGVDSRAAAEVAELHGRLGREAVLARCGKHLSSQALGAKILWASRHVGNWRPGLRWCSAHSFITQRLTGRWTLDHHTASQCDPFYDLRAQDWAHDWAEEVLPGLSLPELAWPGEVIGEVREGLAEETGLAAGTPVLAGTVDAWAEGYSAGMQRPGDLMIMYGSTVFLIQVLPAAAISPGLWTTSGIAPGSHTMAAGMATSGNLLQWWRHATGDPGYDELLAEAQATPPGSDGLLHLPYLAGERSPLFDPDARGVLAGLTLRHTRGHVFRAAHEGIAYGIRQILDDLAAVSGPPARVLAVGGGTSTDFWPQVVSDVTGLTQEVPATAIGASYGDALLAAIAAGLVPPGTTWAATGHRIEPDPARRALYDELYPWYLDLHRGTADIQHALAAHQHQAAPLP